MYIVISLLRDICEIYGDKHTCADTYMYSHTYIAGYVYVIHPPTHTQTHTHAHMDRCMCVSVYVYVGIHVHRK